MALVSSENIIDLTQVMFTQSSDDYDTSVSTSESIIGYTTCNYTDPMRRTVLHANHTPDVQENEIN